MKTHNLYILIFLILATSCKQGLDVKFRTIFKKSTVNQAVSENKFLNKKESNGSFSHFGDFIGTITPTKVSVVFNALKFLDSDTDDWPGTTIELIDNHLSHDDTLRYADFTNGNSIELKPTMYGNTTNEGWFVNKDVVLKYLIISPRLFVFDFNLPEQYNSVQIINDHSGIDNYPPSEGFGFPPGFNDFTVRNGNKLTCISQFFLQHEYLGASNSPAEFIFGGTDSCYIVKHDNIPDWEKCGMIQKMNSRCVARSGNYISPILTEPLPGITKTITTTISFNSNDIIEVYAGRDNVPYTYDDIFAFPPKFWDRFKVEITQN